MIVRRPRKGTAAALAVSVLVLGAGCSTGERVSTRRPEEAQPTEAQPTETRPSGRGPGSPAAPFQLSPAPDGWTISAIVDGAAEPRFSDDSFGGTKPLMILVPDDWRGLDDHRWIVIFSIDGSGNEGGFYQELPAYTHIEEGQGRVPIGNHPAIAWPSQVVDGEANRRTAAFVAINTSTDRDDDLDGGTQRGLLITGTIDDLDLLQSVAKAAGADAERTPTLESAPDGWRVLGTLSASQARNTDEGSIDAQPTGRRVALLSDDAGHELWVTAFPGDETTPLLKAIEAMWTPYDVDAFGDARQFRLDGADAALVACCGGDGPASTATAWFSLDGSPFSVHGPASLIGTPDLASRFAAGIMMTTADEWAAAKVLPTTAPRR